MTTKTVLLLAALIAAVTLATGTDAMAEAAAGCCAALASCCEQAMDCCP